MVGQESSFDPARGSIVDKSGVREVADDGRPDTPDVARVLGDRAVGGELPHARDVEQRLAAPRRAVEVKVVDARLRLDVRLEVGEVDVLVARAGELRHDGTEDVFVAAREVPRGDGVDDAPDGA